MIKKIYIASAVKGASEVFNTKVFSSEMKYGYDTGLISAKDWILDQIATITGSVSKKVMDDPVFDKNLAIETLDIKVTAPWLETCSFRIEPKRLADEDLTYSESETLTNILLAENCLIANGIIPPMMEQKKQELAVKILDEMDPVYDPYRYIVNHYLDTVLWEKDLRDIFPIKALLKVDDKILNVYHITKKEVLLGYPGRTPDWIPVVDDGNGYKLVYDKRVLELKNVIPVKQGMTA